MSALKASWTVCAGVIPGEAVDRFTKRWDYTSEDHARDQAITEPQVHATFAKIRAEAMDYYLQVSSPSISNWAQVTFLWY